MNLTTYGEETMMPASILAEAIRNEEPLHVARERLAAREHVARNYRAIALPALAAATQRVAAIRAARPADPAADHKPASPRA